ncbi:DUF4230 domain-containing protein [Frankia sp. CNm7]|uniref:DUF4230 domain-containing protein n=1 Tax=Frankia nepalensis TaxID=1836974 RepID=A0A937ULF6_9ACTN|nr:DUF4230 domain-containing protein [Frankia nepalensis]MBL7495407.1 DUF4230 domain-containing protein [Frankia nepalensis]MBL7514839.1 DUF4230 domain-containing protein [Frankia nepalensis]MBL7522426.1 DUF4230 domain-containing protein [Frankia nepalensis]MBL7625963.1 DUF4230 domain-containing protein [Frankia nepalensis]
MSDESGRSTKRSPDTLPLPEDGVATATKGGDMSTDGETSSRRGGRIPRLPSPGALFRILALLLVLVVAAGLVSFVAGWRPSLNPFKEREIDRSSPAVLRSLEDLSDYHAASGHFEVVVDVEEDTKWIPSSLKGERVLFVGIGTVDAVVNFGGLDVDRIIVSEDGKTVTIRLPAPTLSKPQMDFERSYVVARQRGALDRIGGLFGGQSTDQGLYIKATEQMTAAAAADGQIIALGKANTTSMLQGLLGALGYENVSVIYEEDQK